MCTRILFKKSHHTRSTRHKKPPLRFCVYFPTGWRLGGRRRAAVPASHSPSGLLGVLQGSPHPPAEPQLWWISALHGCGEGPVWRCEIPFGSIQYTFIISPFPTWDQSACSLFQVYDIDDGLKTFDFLSHDCSTLVVGNWYGEVAIVDRRTPGYSIIVDLTEWSCWWFKADFLSCLHSAEEEHSGWAIRTVLYRNSHFYTLKFNSSAETPMSPSTHWTQRLCVVWVSTLHSSSTLLWQKAGTADDDEKNSCLSCVSLY